jgi:DNA-binding NarL/FixJ family response regulator
MPQAETVGDDVSNRVSCEERPSTPRGAINAEPLSDKEEKILQLISEGMTNRQIATTLFLAEGTVKNYVSRIMEKLHANTRTELALRSKRQSRPE